MKPYRGFRHHHTLEEMRAWAAVPARVKLRRLWELHQFLQRFMPPEAKEAAEKLRRGEW